MLSLCVRLCVYFLLAGYLLGCDTKVRGVFGWANQDNRAIQAAERKLRIATKFYLNRKDLYFYDYETIWWIYRIQSGFYFDDRFWVALYESSSTPYPILSDLREAHLLREDCCDYIRYYYETLKPGSYVLRIAYDSKVIDSAKFIVITEREDKAPSQGREELEFQEIEGEQESFYGYGAKAQLPEEAQVEIDEIEHYSRGALSSQN